MPAHAWNRFATGPRPGPARGARAPGPAVARTALLLAAALGAGSPAAQTTARSPEEVLGAIVAVHAEIPPDARTAPTLGVKRTGSGIVIDSEGLVLTIGYLILEASKAEIVVGNRWMPARILAYDYDTGFGLLRAGEPLDVPPMRLGRSAAVEESARVLVASFGGPEAVRPAVVVSRREFAGYWEYLLDNAIFTSPPYPAFAGAALIGPGGDLLGVGSLIVGAAENGQSPLPGNMFIPIDLLPPILGDLMVAGRAAGPRRPWLGVFAEAIRGRILVTRVEAEGPAARAGIEAGDIILAVGGDAVSSLADFYRRVWARGEAGAEVPLVVLKGSSIAEIAVRSGNRYDWLRRMPGSR